MGKERADFEAIKVRGFGRLQIVNAKTGKIEGDSRWCKNLITDTGFDDLIVGAIGGIANSSQVTHMALGTQTDAAVSTQTSMSGEAAWAPRKTTTESLVGNGTLQATASWDTDEATGSNIGSVGLYGTSTGGSIGNVILVSTSAKTTDQTLNATVQWQFS